MMPIPSYPVSPQLLDCWQHLPAKEILCLGLLLPDHSRHLDESLDKLVSSGDRQRAKNFQNPDDRLRHLLGRAMLRQTLALPDMEFPVNPWGKPEFPGGRIHFNISHGGREVWVALSKTTSVGIDVEEESIPDVRDLANSLHPQEAEAILSLPPDQASIAFCRCWTRKEAALKALGQGLSVPLADFQVATDNRPTDWLIEPPRPPVRSWTVADLPVSQGHRGAIAALSADQVVKVLRLAPHPDGHFVACHPQGARRHSGSSSSCVAERFI